MKKLWQAGLIVAIWLISRIPSTVSGSSEAIHDSTALASLGLMILAGHLLGKWLSELGIPQITGYMLVGILGGPYAGNVLSFEMIDRLKTINNIALVMIALSAGGELRLPELKGMFRTISLILVSQTVLILSFSFIAILIAGSILFQFDGYNLAQLTAIGLLLGTMTAANSPSVAVAVISELKARGRISNLIMAVTVPKDVIVIILFAISMALARTAFNTAPDETGAHPTLLILLLSSIIIGVCGGVLVVLYLKYINKQVEIALLIASLILIRLVQEFNLELLLSAVVMGFIVENLSQQGKHLINGLSRVTPPIFVVFFAFAGAAVNLSLFNEIMLVAVFWTLFRAGLLWVGTYTGLKLDSRGSSRSDKYAWLGYLPQAGVALGLTTIVSAEFPTFGARISTLILTVVAFNQILGPIGLRYALMRAGEADADAA